MTRESIDKKLNEAINAFPDLELRAKLNSLRNNLISAASDKDLTHDEFTLKSTRLHEDFNIDVEHGTTSNK